MNLEQSVSRITHFTPLVTGFLLGMAVMLLSGAGANEPGPYHCREAGTNDTAIFVIDTRDGHIWRMSKSEFLDFGTPLKPAVKQTGTAASAK